MPAHETHCSQCGAEVGGESSRQHRPIYDREGLRFARAIFTRPATFTFVFLIANVFVFILMSQEGGFDIATLLAFGAKQNFLINQGEWWRFVTPVFIHIGLPHLLINMYGLWILGPYVEKLYGSSKFVVFWILTGIAGVVASYLTVRPDMHVNSIGRFLFKSQDVPSAGASGALFGLVGVLFVFGLKFRHELPEGFKRAFGTGMLPVILLNFFIGYMGRGFIDNAAHMGGLAAGAALALVVGYKRPGEPMTVTLSWRLLQVLALALVIVSFALVAKNFHNPAHTEMAQQASAAPAQNVNDLVSALNAGPHALTAALVNQDTSQLDEAIKAVESAPPVDHEAGKLLESLRSLLERTQTLLKAEQSTNERTYLEEKQRLEKDILEWIQRRNEWVENNGGNFGISLPKASPSDEEGKSL